MPKTSIEWTDFSINPIRARDKETGATGHFCIKISSGCTNCYASRLQSRFKMHEFLAKNMSKVEIFFDEGKLNAICSRKTPTKWFVCDMTDLFGEWVPDAWIDMIFRAIAKANRHTFQILTKRPKRMLEYCAARWDSSKPDPWKPLPNVWLGVSVEDQRTADERIPLLLDTPAAIRFVSAEPLLGAIDFTDHFLKPLRMAISVSCEKQRVKMLTD